MSGNTPNLGQFLLRTRSLDQMLKASWHDHVILRVSLQKRQIGKQNIYLLFNLTTFNPHSPSSGHRAFITSSAGYVSGHVLAMSMLAVDTSTKNMDYFSRWCLFFVFSYYIVHFSPGHAL